MPDDGVTRRTLLGGIGTGAFAVGVGPAAARDHGRYVVGTKSPAADRAAEQAADAVHRRLDFGGIGRAVAGRFPRQAIDNLAKRPDVRYVEAEGQYHAIAETTPWGVDRVDADVVHANGETGGDNDDGEGGADVAIIDSGIDDDHPDLDGNIGQGAAFVDCSGSNCTHSWSDDNDHGTHCAGIADAEDNSEGVVGVSTAATLHAVKVLADDGSGYWSDVAAGIEWVADQGYDVANISLGGSSSSSTVRDACQYAAERGVLLVAAAGNQGPCSDCVSYPARYDTVMAISATASDDSLADFSSTGPEVDLAAPGQDVYSTVIDGYARFSGTSMACPHVAGAGAQLMDNGYTASEARRRLVETAEDVGLADNEGGAGLLDVEAAMGASSDAAPSVGWHQPSDGDSLSGTVSIRIEASDGEDADDALTVEYRVDGDTWRTATYDSSTGDYEDAWDSTTVADGEHTLDARATDSAGNRDTATISVSTDNTDAAPTVSWVTPTDGDTVGGTVSLSIDAEDDSDSGSDLTVEWQVDDGDWQAAAYDSGSGTYEDSWDSTSVADGDHTIAARASDSAGNVSTARITVTTDNTDAAPSVTWVSPNGGETLGGTVQIAIDATDEEDSDSDLTVEWQVDDGNWRSATYDAGSGTYEDSWDTTAVADGEHTLYARATDSSGNVSTEASSTVTVSNAESEPAIDSYVVTEAGSPNPHAEITADWAVGDADGDLEGVRIDVIDASSGSVVDSASHNVSGTAASGSDSFKRKHARGATYDVAITVTDAAGNSASATDTVSE